MFATAAIPVDNLDSAKKTHQFSSGLFTAPTELRELFIFYFGGNMVEEVYTAMEALLEAEEKIREALIEAESEDATLQLLKIRNQTAQTCGMLRDYISKYAPLHMIKFEDRSIHLQKFS